MKILLVVQFSFHQMSSEVRAYFEDTEESAKRLLQTMRFQKNHRFNLFKTYKKIVSYFYSFEIALTNCPESNLLSSVYF